MVDAASPGPATVDRNEVRGMVFWGVLRSRRVTRLCTLYTFSRHFFTRGGSYLVTRSHQFIGSNLLGYNTTWIQPDYLLDAIIIKILASRNHINMLALLNQYACLDQRSLLAYLNHNLIASRNHFICCINSEMRGLIHTTHFCIYTSISPPAYKGRYR